MLDKAMHVLVFRKQVQWVMCSNVQDNHAAAWLFFEDYILHIDVTILRNDVGAPSKLLPSQRIYIFIVPQTAIPCKKLPLEQQAVEYNST